MNVEKTLRHCTNGDIHERAEVGIDRLMKAEVVGAFLGEDMPLQEEFARWRSLERKGFVRRREYTVREVAGTSQYLVDVREDNPAHATFSVIRAADDGTERYDKHVSLVRQMRAGEHPVEHIRYNIIAEYAICRGERYASAYRIKQIVGGLKRDYARLLLPLCDDLGHVTTLVGVARHFEVPFAPQ